jgi:N-acetylmuramic acid 6-phosphate etherase
MSAKGTEESSNHDRLDERETIDLLKRINQEDQSVALAIERVIPSIDPLVKAIIQSLKQGGRLFYIGAGTSGRLGILDASECPPTYGVPAELVTGLIAGGDSAIRKAVEGAEDDKEQGFKDLINAGASPGDVVVGITASGRTPYVLGAVEEARKNGIVTAGISCNANSALSKLVDHPIEVLTGAEFVTGSTRMKAGTAQKMVLNMLSTTSMIGLGRVKGNRMVDMQLTNRKLVHRGTQMLMQMLDLNQTEAEAVLLEHGSVRKALSAHGHR